MTPQEAIETQEIYLKGEEAVEHDKLIASMKLGIEALRFFEGAQLAAGGYYYLRLPGETEE